MIVFNKGAQSAIKNIVAVTFGLLFLYVFIGITCDHMHSMFPDTYPETFEADLAILSRMFQSPGRHWVYLIAPVLYSLSAYQLSLVAHGSIYGTFNAKGTRSLRIAGYCMDLGGMATFGAMLLVPGSAFSMTSETLLVMFVGGTLIALSHEGNTLFKHANKLRDNLDEIV